jgi:hypothetical protein
MAWWFVVPAHFARILATILTRKTGSLARVKTGWNKVAAWAFPRTLRLFLDPFIHARDMLPPESIKIGGSLARA